MRGQLYRLYPTPKQADRLNQWVGAVRAVYNIALEQRRTFWRPGRRFDFVSQGREITALRREFDWIADVPCTCLHQALRDLDRAYRNWWDGNAGAPDFRRRELNDSIRFHDAKYIRLRQTGRRIGVIGLPKIGGIRLRLDRPLRGKIRQTTVIRRAGKWYAACLVEGEFGASGATGGPVGIDRGVRAFVALSTGELISGPNVGRAAAKALARAQRKLARKVKGSANRRKQRQRVARLHAGVANARRDFLHKLSTTIAKNHGVVVMEDLRIKNMVRSAAGTVESPGKNVRQKAGLNRSTLDQGWGTFHRFLAYKIADRGGQLILVPANDTSRTCAACGVLDKDSRKAERFVCTACGHSDDADLNAAINILRRGRASVLPVEGGVLDTPDEAGTSGRAA